MDSHENHENFHFKTNEGACDLEGAVRWVGGDLLVAVWGGTHPHIGAVALAQPRPSLKDPQAISATASVLCVVGHKEDDLAKMASERLAAVLNTRVVVTAGIHWDNLDEAGIRRVMSNADILVGLIAEKMKDLCLSHREK